MRFFTAIYQDDTEKTFEGEEGDTVTTPDIRDHAKQIGYSIPVTLIRPASEGEMELCKKTRRYHAEKLSWY